MIFYIPGRFIPMAGERGCWGTSGPPSCTSWGRALVSGRLDPSLAEPGHGGEKSAKKSICEWQVKGRLQLNPPPGTSVTEGEEVGLNWTKKPQGQCEEMPSACLKCCRGIQDHQVQEFHGAVHR